MMLRKSVLAAIAMSCLVQTPVQCINYVNAAFVGGGAVVVAIIAYCSCNSPEFHAALEKCLLQLQNYNANSVNIVRRYLKTLDSKLAESIRDTLRRYGYDI